jgi:hypothetical protein
MKWDVSAMRIRREQQGASFFQYVTRLCALVGGMWAVLGLLYSGGRMLAERYVVRRRPSVLSPTK